jgi:hypothetical protein
MLIRVPGDSSQTDAAALEVNKEQDVICHQSAPRNDLDGEKEIDPGQHGYVRWDEFPPRVAFRLRFAAGGMPCRRRTLPTVSSETL